MRLLLPALAIVGFVPPAAAQIVTEMTPERIRDAIAFGESGKAKPYQVGSLAVPANFTTPFLRVALAAASAKEKYKKLTEEEVNDNLVLPGVLRLYATAIPPSKYGSATSVRTVVIMPPGEKDRDKAIHPDTAEPVARQWSNRLGATDEAEALWASFPLSVLRDGAELRIVYSNGNERKVKFKLDKVR